MISGAGADRPKTYNLTRRFAFGAIVVIAAAGCALYFANRSMSVSQLERMAERNNSVLTQTVANTLWPRYRVFLNAARSMTADAIRADGRTAALQRSVSALLTETPILKVKLYDLGGLTVFSTDPRQIGADYRTNPRFLKAIGGGVATELEFRQSFATVDGPAEDRWVLSSYIPVRPAGGSIEGVAEVYSDVTAVYATVRQTEYTILAVIGAALLAVFLLLLAFVWRAERQMKRYYAENLELAASYARADSASRSKSAFLANMSHELRTPLNAIIGFAEMIKGAAFGPVGDGRYVDYASDIYRSGNHLLHIVRDVLDLVDIETGRMPVARGEFDLCALAEDVVRMQEDAARRKGVTLAAEGTCPTVVSDEAKLRQILINLTANAIAFSPKGGTVTLSIDDNEPQNTCRITIADQGSGMAADDIATALAPFGQLEDPLTREHGGVGLGLPLSKQFAELLGGTLRIETAKGAGTKVIVELPRRAGPDALPAAA